MVRSLLESFLPTEAAGLDWPSLEPVPAPFVADVGARRAADTIWRVRVAVDPSVTVIVLLEFQSSVDKRMAQRVEVYASLCMEAASRREWGRPPNVIRILPVVVYNGSQRWTADIAATAKWAAAESGKPDPSYRLVDLVRARKYRLEGGGVAGSLARLLTEGESMIAETMKRWTDEWLEQGAAKGLERGRREGLAEGAEQALAEQKELLRCMAEEKFGAEVAAELARLLQPVCEPSRTRTAGLWIMQSKTGEDLLARFP